MGRGLDAAAGSCVLSIALLLGSALAAATPGVDGGSSGGAADSAAGPSYLRDLALQDRADQVDLIRMLARFVGTNQPEVARARDGSFDSALDALKRSGIVDASHQPREGRVVERGDAALLFARALHSSGGVTGGLFGVGRRSAYRELVDKQIMVGGGEGFEMSGAELIGLLQRALAYRRSRGGQ